MHSVDYSNITAPNIRETFDVDFLLSTVFDPLKGLKVCIMIDLEDPSMVKDFAFLNRHEYPVQKKAYNLFYTPLHESVMKKYDLTGGEMFAYKTTGGSNLDLPDEGYDSNGNKVNLAEAVYKVYDLVLCISTHSATAPLTAHAKNYGFRGATLHGLNDVIMSSGLSVDYREVSANAEKLRLGVTKADWVEIDFVINEDKHTLKLILENQEAQKSHGLCHGTQPDVANLPAGEVYFVPHGAEGAFPMRHEDGTLGLNVVQGGRVVDVSLIKGNPNTIESYKDKLASDPICGEIGELGMGTQILPYSGADIQDEKVLGTVHVATGRSDHLGGHLTPDKFAEAGNASHDDILFHPDKTPEILISEVRMKRNEQTEVLIENYSPAAYFVKLLNG